MTHEDLPVEFSSTLPIRVRKPITISVGQGEGDLQGNDDKVIQSAIDYVTRLGGGCVQILPGTYTLHNAIYMKSGITLRGCGDTTILRKAPGVTSLLEREADWYEYCIQVADPKGFTVGGGIALTTSREEFPAVRLYTITAINGSILYLDQRTEKNYWLADSANASTRHSILHALDINDVRVQDIVLDGNRFENDNLNGNYGAAVFMQYCNRWTFKNVTVKDFNGDGFSFQVCDDIRFENCESINNADLGFHPGSGSQRPIFINCTANGNSQGFFWCWGACHGLADGCTASDNTEYGINIGHRDTQNLIRNCTIERNGEVGILFRQEGNEFFTGDSNTIEGCTIRDNGHAVSPGCGIDITVTTKDITIRNCKFENSAGGKQTIDLRIGPDVGEVNLDGNTFQGGSTDIQDNRTAIFVESR